MRVRVTMPRIRPTKAKKQKHAAIIRIPGRPAKPGPKLSGRGRRVGAEISEVVRKRAEAEAAIAKARKSHERLREAIDILPQGIVFLDAEGRYILWNKKYAEIYSRSSDLFKPGARLQDTIRIGVERGDYPEAIGREEEWIAERLARLYQPGKRHEQLLADGSALEKFNAMLMAQGADPSTEELKMVDLGLLDPKANASALHADRSGYITSMNTREIGLALQHLGAGRQRAEDTVSPKAGIEITPDGA